MATGWETLPPPAVEEPPTDKEARDAHIRDEFLLPANEGRKVNTMIECVHVEANSQRTEGVC